MLALCCTFQLRSLWLRCHSKKVLSHNFSLVLQKFQQHKSISTCLFYVLKLIFDFLVQLRLKLINSFSQAKKHSIDLVFMLIVLFFDMNLLLYYKINTLSCFLAERNNVIVDELKNFYLSAFCRVLEGQDVVVLMLVAQYAVYAEWSLARIAESLNFTFFVLITEPIYSICIFWQIKAAHIQIIIFLFF